MSPGPRAGGPGALTLRLLGGLHTEEVARAFLVTDTTMAQRLVRAKRKIKLARIPYRVPRETELPSRLRAVLTVLYLIYNAGADDAADDLRTEAIRLARLVTTLLTDEPEATGLLALLLLTESRYQSRTTTDGRSVLLRDPGPHPLGPRPDRRGPHTRTGLPAP